MPSGFVGVCTKSCVFIRVCPGAIRKMPPRGADVMGRSWGGASNTSAPNRRKPRPFGRDGRLVRGRGGFAPRGRQGAPDEAVRTVVATGTTRAPKRRKAARFQAAFDIVHSYSESLLNRPLGRS